jgi:hypothetical protein
VPLQSSDLVMIGLGVQGDAPPNAVQPRLADGVHLRWAFNRSLGFPWYGFLLFRRPHVEGKERLCVTGPQRSPTGAAPQTPSSPTWPTSYGAFSSDQPIAFTDDFPPTGVDELDLAGRSYLHFALEPLVVARTVTARIGFRGAKESRACVDFSRDRPAQGEGALVRSATRFVARKGGTIVPWSIRLASTTAGTLAGLDCGVMLEIDLPYASRAVELRLTHFGRPGNVSAFDAAGARVATHTMQGPAKAPETVVLTAASIVRVVVESPADEVLLHEMCFVGTRAAKRSEIAVTAYLGAVPVATKVVAGAPGDVVVATLAFDAITAVRCSAGDAVLIELCFVPIRADAARGWELCRKAPVPIGLPVTHPDYPCTGNAPVDEPAAENVALGRIAYGSPAPWAASFAELHHELVGLVQGGPSSTPMADRTLALIPGTPNPPDPGLVVPALPAQRPLDLVMLASLHPAMAQMLGLYWIDRSAVPGVAYDYLVVANYEGYLSNSPADVLQGLFGGAYGVYGYITFGLAVAPAPPLPLPVGVRAYALAGATRAVQGGGLDDATNSAGLRWDLGTVAPGILAPGHAVMYHVWRADLHDGAAPMPGGTYQLLTHDQPVLAAEPLLPPGVTVQYPDNWPPFAMYYIDSALPDGWYGYRISGIDVFGRHSANSNPAAWYEWGPAPDPQPWYYIAPPGDTVVNASAVRLLAKLPPPPPSAVEAYALDPLDTTLVRDAAYQAWFGPLTAGEKTGLVGLRVRWLWTSQAMRQAPRTKEFRIYYTAGRPNAVSGRITAVAAEGPAASAITTDIANAQPAGAYAGAAAWIGATAYAIVGSDAATPLVLHVTNLGRTETAGTASVTNGSATVTGAGTAWDAGLLGLSFQVDGINAVYTVLNVVSATQLTLSIVYGEASAPAAAYQIFQKRPVANAGCTIAVPRVYSAGTVTLAPGSATVNGDGGQAWTAALAGQVFRVQNDLTKYRVAAVAGPAQLTLDRPFAGPAGGPGFIYTIEFPLFRDLSDEATWDDRRYVVPYNQNVTVTTDAAGKPLRIYEVIIPQAGDASRAGLPLTTTLANPIAYAQIGVSAADDRIHTADDPKWDANALGHRTGNEGRVGGPATIFRVRHEPPPPPGVPPDADRVFATPADYHAHSFYTYRWQPAANLRTHVFRALDDAVFKTDWTGSRPRAPIDPNTDLAFFPDPAVDARWDAPKRAEVATELNGLNAFAHDAAGTSAAFAAYAVLSNDALRILAALPGNENAYTQLTTLALDPNDPANANRVGPDDPSNVPVDAALRAYVDTLDGRSTNRYFYRCCYVDTAHNRGPLGLASPPVWLHKVMPPRIPTLTKALGGERQIELHWASNREPDLARYELYRTDARDRARDLRLMALVHTANAPAGDPSARPADNVWTDTGVAGLITYYYAMIAVDTTGNASAPSVPVAVRAHDEALPAAPPLAVSWDAGIAPAHATATWTSVHETLLERRATINFIWDSVGGWRPPGANDQVLDIDHTFDWQFRVRVRKDTGAAIVGAIVPLGHM